MSKDLTEALIIGTLLGLVVALSNVLESGVGLILSIITCIVAGSFSAKIQSHPKMFAILSILITYPFLAVSYGLKDGVAILVGIMFIHGTLSFGFTLAFQNAIYNFKAIKSWLFGRK